MKILVSACLLGENCKYNGGNNLSPATVAFIGGREALPVCPEMEAGMGCPRIPIEIRNGVLVDQNGNEVDAPMRAAIARILERMEGEQIACAVLKNLRSRMLPGTCAIDRRAVYFSGLPPTLSSEAPAASVHLFFSATVNSSR